MFCFFLKHICKSLYREDGTLFQLANQQQVFRVWNLINMWKLIWVLTDAVSDDQVTAELFTLQCSRLSGHHSSISLEMTRLSNCRMWDSSHSMLLTHCFAHCRKTQSNAWIYSHGTVTRISNSIFIKSKSVNNSLC